MTEFFTHLWQLITSLVWFDWLTIAVILGFIALGWVRGLMRESIHLGLSLTTLFIGWWCYQDFATSAFIAWFDLSARASLTLAFWVLVFGALVIKAGLFQLSKRASAITQPCVLNKPVVFIIWIALSVIVSNHYWADIAALDFTHSLIQDSGVRTLSSFVAILSVIVLGSFGLMRLLNVIVDTQKPCWFKPIFQKTLSTFSTLDTFLNARNATRNQITQTLGAFIGLFKASALILLLVVSLQNSHLSQHYDWIESRGALHVLQNIAADISPTLSSYFIFIPTE